MTPTTSNPGTLRALLILHKIMLAGQLIFLMVAFFLGYKNLLPFQHSDALNRILQVLAIIFSVGGFYAGALLFKKRLLADKEMLSDPKEKLLRYRQACIIQWSLIEGPCIFAIVSFLLTGNYAFMALAVVLIMAFAMMAPSKMKIAFQLQISEEEAEEL